jgi:hypothetical protein
MKLDDLARNKTISEFAAVTGIAVTTLRDWNKRGLAKGIGQPAPNGHWLYSKTDAAKVEIASILYANSINWKTSLYAGNVMGGRFETASRLTKSRTTVQAIAMTMRSSLRV